MIKNFPIDKLICSEGIWRFMGLKHRSFLSVTGTVSLDKNNNFHAFYLLHISLRVFRQVQEAL